MVVTGDTRTDQVVHRWKAAEDGPLAKLLAATGYSYLALGSIWPPDEACILEPALEAVAADPQRGLIAVPHEPACQPSNAWRPQHRPMAWNPSV